MHAHVYQDHGSCPHYTKNIYGRDVKASFYGPTPFIYFNPISGSDINLANLLAGNYGFNIKFIPEKTKTTTGLLHRVSKNLRKIKKEKYVQNLIFLINAYDDLI